MTAKKDTDNTKRNIYQRLAAAMESVKYVQKDQPTNGLKYAIVTHDAVTAKVRPALLNEGVVYHPQNLTHTKDGNRTEVSLEVKFTNIDTPADFIVVPSFGYGIDNQDKGPGKAISYAVKYALLKALGLETGDDPDLDQNAIHIADEKKTTDPSWVGPLAKNKLVDAARAIGRDVSACTDLDSLVVLEISKETVEITDQLEKDLPHFWDHEPDPSHELTNYDGLSQQFEKRKEELTNGLRT